MRVTAPAPLAASLSSMTARFSSLLLVLLAVGCASQNQSGGGSSTEPEGGSDATPDAREGGSCFPSTAPFQCIGPVDVMQPCNNAPAECIGGAWSCNGGAEGPLDAGCNRLVCAYYGGACVKPGQCTSTMQILQGGCNDPASVCCDMPSCSVLGGYCSDGGVAACGDAGVAAYESSCGVCCAGPSDGG